MQSAQSVRLLLAAIMACIILLAGWWIAFYFQIPEAFRRTGALLSAFGTLGIVWQVFIEMILEEEAKNIEQVVKNTSVKAAGQTSGVRELKDRLIRNVQRAEVERHRIQRLRLVGFFAVIIAIGTMVHGFGDYLVPSARDVAQKDSHSLGRTANRPAP